MASRRDKTINRKLLRHERSLQPWPTGSARCRRHEEIERVDWQPLPTDNWLTNTATGSADIPPITLAGLTATIQELRTSIGMPEIR